jgi:quercetin dioxygenase-like cupin family protein
MMTTSKPQKLLLRLIVLFAICASIPLRPAMPERGVISEQLGLIVPVEAQAPVTLDRSIRDYKLPAEIPWVERNGTGSLTLYGDASKPGGIYVSLLRRPFDNWSAPHTHPTERYVTVLDGTFLAGTGPVQDRNRVDALKVGTVVSEVPGRMHYDGVGQDGVTLFFIGMGGANSGPPNEPPRAPGGPNVDPTARVAKRVEDMMWTKAADGSTFTNVFGEPGKAGLYVQFVRRPPNSWSTAHRHANDQFVWVMGGRMYIGTGSSVDKDKTVGMPKGSYIHDFANGTHYEGTRDEDLWLLVAGMGPGVPEKAD